MTNYRQQIPTTKTVIIQFLVGGRGAASFQPTGEWPDADALAQLPDGEQVRQLDATACAFFNQAERAYGFAESLPYELTRTPDGQYSLVTGRASQGAELQLGSAVKLTIG